MNHTNRPEPSEAAVNAAVREVDWVALAASEDSAVALRHTQRALRAAYAVDFPLPGTPTKDAEETPEAAARRFATDVEYYRAALKEIARGKALDNARAVLARIHGPNQKRMG